MPFISEKDAVPRILSRGATQKFRVGFFEDESQAVPLIPKDPLLYPSFSIVSSSGITLQSGILQPDGGVGYYSTLWTIPQDAELSNANSRYRFEVSILTNTNAQAEFTHEFDVQDVAITAENNRDQMFISLSGRTFRALLRRTLRIDLDGGGDLVLELLLSNVSGTKQTISPGGLNTSVSFSAGEIREVPDGDSFVYVYDIPENIIVNCSDYILLWSIRDNQVSAEEIQFQKVKSVNGQTLNLAVQLRILIDKYQKQRGRVQAYEDSDIIEYLDRGLDIINTVHPLTGWNMSMFPHGPFTSFLMIASAWYGLNAQYLSEVDLSFNFSGQTTTLEYDHAPMIADAIGRFKEFLDNNVMPAKIAWVRRTSSVGTFAGRPMGYRGLHRYVFPMQTLSSGDIMTTLSRIGILR